MYCPKNHPCSSSFASPKGPVASSPLPLRTLLYALYCRPPSRLSLPLIGKIPRLQDFKKRCPIDYRPTMLAAKAPASLPYSRQPASASSPPTPSITNSIRFLSVTQPMQAHVSDTLWLLPPQRSPKYFARRLLKDGPPSLSTPSSHILRRARRSLPVPDPPPVPLLLPSPRLSHRSIRRLDVRCACHHTSPTFRCP